MSVKTLYLCHSCEAPDVEDRNVQAYRDAQSMDQTFPLLCYSSIAQPFATSYPHNARTLNSNGLFDTAYILFSVPSYTLYFHRCSMLHGSAICDVRCVFTPLPSMWAA
jgi:hypothetical protein